MRLWRKPETNPPRPVGAAAPSLRQHAVARLRGSTTFFKFLVVGTFGYLVSVLFIYLLYDSPAFPFLPDKGSTVALPFGLDGQPRLIIATVVAVEMSILSNFFWHNVWTFSDRARRLPMGQRFVVFNLTSIGSPAIQFVTVNVLTPNFGVSPYLAIALGVAIGMTWNWLWNVQVIWRKGKEPA